MTNDRAGADAESPAEAEKDPAAAWVKAKLCPGCCAIEDIPEWEPTVEVLTPLAECERCGFRFPILPADCKQLTFDALRHHECTGIHKGNWPELGLAIVRGMRELGLDPDALTKKLNGTWWPSHAPFA
jgi:hypothetical protein